MATAATSTRPGRSRGKGASAAKQPGLWTFFRGLLNAPLADYYLILGAVTILLVFGVTMVTSASSISAIVNTEDAWYFAKRQVFFVGVGALLAWWLSRRAIGTLRMFGLVGVAVSVVLLSLTLVAGTEVNGNRSWLSIGAGFALQPSEFAKWSMIVWGADVLAKARKSLDQPSRILFPFVPGSLLMICLVLLQHDMGTSVVMTAILFSILFFVGTPARILALFGAGGAAGVVLLVLGSGNRMTRIRGFLSPSQDTDGINRQANQSLLGIAAGGWTGRGLSHSRQKYGFLPEAHTDFIFAILSEELGLFGSLTVVVLFFVLGFAGLRCAMKSDDLFCRLASAGCTVWLLFQAVLNIFVVLQLLPVTGVPLPFVSYGGSALLGNLMAVGVLLACARNEPAARKARSRRDARRSPRLTSVVDGGRA